MSRGKDGVPSAWVPVKDVVLIGFVTTTLDALTVLVEGGLQRDGLVIQVQIGELGGDEITRGVVPGTVANPRTGEHQAFFADAVLK